MALWDLLSLLAAAVGLYVVVECRSSDRAQEGMLAVFCATMLLTAYHAGGIDSPHTVWLTLVPWAAVLFRGYRSGAFWATAICVGLLLLYGLAAAGYASPSPVPGEFRELWHLLSYLTFLPTAVALIMMDEERRLAALRALTAEQSRLVASEKRFRDIAESVADWIWETDGSGSYIYSSPGVERLLGYKPEELMGKRPTDFMSARQAEEYRREVSGLIAARQPIPGITVRYLTKDGEERIVLTTAVPMPGEQGELIGYRGANTDVTALSRQRELEMQLIQAQKMESLGRLAGGIAHDFNNLLTAIMGYGQLLLDSLDPSDKTRTEVQEILKAGERAANLTRMLLTFSRRQSLEMRPVNLADTVLDMAKMLRRLIGQDIELVTKIAPDLWQVQADPAQIQQVIMNLAVNARDAMPEGGKLLFELSHVTFSEDYADARFEIPAGDYVVLMVSDTGTGMSQEAMDHLFEPFFTTKPEGKGTGLGLATVYGIVRQHGGKISVYSEEDKGTTFKVYLPRSKTPAENTIDELKELASPPGRNETLLVVEDEEAIRRLVCRQLTDLGYSVLEANNGSEAIALASNYPDEIHLLITDMIMPYMHGTELAQRLKEARPQIKALYISGHPGTEAQVDVMSADHEPGAAQSYNFLVKPFTGSSLARRVRAILDNGA